MSYTFFFFFQAEDGIRDTSVTGVQTCALPICAEGVVDVYVNDAFGTAHRAEASTHGIAKYAAVACAGPLVAAEIGRASGREGGAGPLMAAEIGRASCRGSGGWRRGAGEEVEQMDRRCRELVDVHSNRHCYA